jgi:putative Ca2+/H+ antiporter (TMEM165/GDT1 family)
MRRLHASLWLFIGRRARRAEGGGRVQEVLEEEAKAKASGTFWTGFIRSFLVIVVIEVGDRTFFIAALMGIKYNQLLVFVGAFGALTFMTVVSTVMGVAAPMLLPRWFTHYAAFVLFTFFGCQLVHKASGMKHGVSEELEEVRAI